MTPAEIKAWQEQHGGAAGTEGPDANGITVYRANDGSFINVRADGSLAMRGSGPAATPSAQSQPAPIQPSSGVGPTTQQQLEARIAQTPGLVYRGQTLKTKPNPQRAVYGQPATIQVPVVTWVNPTNGYTVEAEIGDGGTYTVTQDAVIEANRGKGTGSNDPTARNAAELQRQREANAALPPGQDPVYETDAERRQRAEARIKEQGAAAEAARKQQPTVEQDAVPGYPGWTFRTVQGEGIKQTLYYPPGSTTPQSSLPAKPDEPKPPSFQQVQGGDGQTYVRSIAIGPNGQPVIKMYGPDGQEVTAIPGEREKPSVTQVRGDDGQVYTTVTTIGPDNRPSVQTFNPSGQVVAAVPQKPDKSEIREVNGEFQEIIRDPKTGNVVEMRPVAKPTATGNAGPPLPHIVVGMSQEALRTYKEQLQSEVAAGRQSQAWANSRWDEAKDMATFAIQESTLQQREYETNVNANVNLAQSRLSYLSTGMGQAISFALHINDRLPPGSAAGGKAFAAMLGLQSINMARSGINDVKLSPTDTRSVIERSRASSGEGPGPVSTRVSNIGNANAVEQQRQAAIDQLLDQLRRETGVSNTTDVGGVPREYTPASSSNNATGQPPSAPAVATVPPATAPATAQSEAAIERTPGGYVNHAIFDPVPTAPPAPSPPGLFPGAGTPTVDTGNVGISPDGTIAVDPAGNTAPVDINRPLPPAETPSPTSLRAPSAGPDLAVLAQYQQPSQEPVPSAPVQGEANPPPLPSATFPVNTSPGPVYNSDGIDITNSLDQPPPRPLAPIQQYQRPSTIPGGGLMQGDPSQGWPLALMRQKILNTPPWRLSSSEFAFAQRNGLMDDAWQIPGRSAVSA